MSLPSNISACHRCLNRAGVRCAGACPCPHDVERRDILIHAKAGITCPLKLHCPEDPRIAAYLARPVEPIPEEFDGNVRRDSKGSESCGCA